MSKLFKDNNLIHSVFFCDYEETLQILKSGNYDKTCLKNIGGFEKDFPLFLISKYYDICFQDFDCNFNHKKENKKILNIWETKFGFSVKDDLIVQDYIGYCNENEPELLIDCNTDKTESISEFYKGKEVEIGEFKKNGITDLELELYYLIVCDRDYHKIKRICEKGARPGFILHPDSEDEPRIIDFTGNDLFFTMNQVLSYLKGGASQSLTIYEIEDLTVWAETLQNYNLMEQFIR